MTGAKASYLKTLSEQLHEPDAYAEQLTKAEASKALTRSKRGGASRRAISRCCRVCAILRAQY
jgi:hypothetical protein